jgi:hypothetical protein
VTVSESFHAVVFGSKRHVEVVIGPHESEVADRTEANLGGFYADPPKMTGRAEDRGRVWSLEAVRIEVAYALDRQRNPTRALRARAPWDEGQRLAFPAVRRLAVVSPEVLRSLPVELRARLGTRYLEAVLDRWFRRHTGGSPVALDPGDDLARWQELRWLDRTTGEPLCVTTDPSDPGAVLLASLASKAAEWSRPPSHEPVGEVVVDPLLVRHLGRISGVIDAEIDGLPSDLGSRRPHYEDVDDRQRQAVAAYASALGKRAFGRRTGLPATVSERAARGGTISKANLRKALRGLRVVDRGTGRCASEGCTRPVFRSGARYCSSKCRSREQKRRQRRALATQSTTASTGTNP